MTAQAHEELILYGEHTSTAFCPPIPEGHPAIETVPDQQAAESHPFVFSTACWRGYIGTWEVKETGFYLRDLKGKLRLAIDEPILADWFTGMLRIPRGDVLHYVHRGFRSVYERELHIQVERGEITGEREVDNRDRDADPLRLGLENLPGNEKRFPGDDEPIDRSKPERD